jgi:hypothetical protein
LTTKALDNLESDMKRPDIEVVDSNSELANQAMEI